MSEHDVERSARPDERPIPHTLGEAQIFYDRARSSGFELLKTVVSLSTATIAAFFFALTAKDAPAIGDEARVALGAALACMVLAVFAGLTGWAADAKFYDESARYIQSRSRTAWARRTKYNAVRRLAITLMAALFFIGIVAAAWYVVLRAR